MEQKTNNNMATASLVMGIISIVLSCCCFMGFIFGGLAILFACLSRVDQGFEGKAKVGLITGIIGLVLGIIAAVIWFILIFASSMQDLDYYSSYGMLSMIQGVVGGGML